MTNIVRPSAPHDVALAAAIAAAASVLPFDNKPGSLERQCTLDGALRMAGNYAAVGLAWRYLCEFAGMDAGEGNFARDLTAEMNTHIAETSADREPWVWILETVLSEIDGGNYKHPYTFDTVDGEFCILLRTGHVMDHIAHTGALRDKWNSLPVKSDRVFKRQLHHAGVVVGEKEVERRIYTRRVPYLTPVSLDRLAGFGLHVSVREDLATDAIDQRGRA